MSLPASMKRSGSMRRPNRSASGRSPITETARGPDHPDVTAQLRRLAHVYEMQSRHAEAEPLYQRALAITESALGPDHPDVRSWLDRLAALYEAQRRYPEAEPLYQRALTIMEKARGPDHPDVRSPLNSLAFLYRAAAPLCRGRAAVQARACHRREGARIRRPVGAESARQPRLPL